MRGLLIPSVALLGCAATGQLGDLAADLPEHPWPTARRSEARPRREVIRIAAPPPARAEAPSEPDLPPGAAVVARPAVHRRRAESARPWSASPPLVVRERLAVVPLPGTSSPNPTPPSPGALAVLPGTPTQTVVAQASTGILDAAASDAYDGALSLVRADRCHDALNAFASFVARWPDHPHADNAMYWRGECFLRLGETQAGIDELDALLRRYPNGNKAPDALLKLSLTWRRLGDDARASGATERLLRDFPGSDAARRVLAERQTR